MAKSPINMVSMVKFAKKQRLANAVEQFEELAKNLLSHAFVEVEGVFLQYCERNKKRYNHEVFTVFQHLFIFLTLSDGHFLHDEYDMYCKYCAWAKFKPLSIADCRMLYDKLTVQNLLSDIRFLTSLRQYTSPEYYTAMVQGLCFIALLGDLEFDENEYYILRGFFQSGFDTFPDSYAKFKIECDI